MEWQHVQNGIYDYLLLHSPHLRSILIFCIPTCNPFIITFMLMHSLQPMHYHIYGYDLPHATHPTSLQGWHFTSLHIHHITDHILIINAPKPLNSLEVKCKESGCQLVTNLFTFTLTAMMRNMYHHHASYGHCYINYLAVPAMQLSFLQVLLVGVIPNNSWRTARLHSSRVGQCV